MPRPPPSERCKSTVPIKLSARIRLMMRTTFSIRGLSGRSRRIAI
jgi:hypothetical protein